MRRWQGQWMAAWQQRQPREQRAIAVLAVALLAVAVSISVFQAPQLGHLHSQRGVLAPHSLQV